MKNRLFFALCGCVALLALAGCGKSSDDTAKDDTNKETPVSNGSSVGKPMKPQVAPGP